MIILLSLVSTIQTFQPPSYTNLQVLKKSPAKPSPGCSRFERCIMLSTGKITIQWIGWFVLSTLICWIAIYPVDSIIQPLNNWGLEIRTSNLDTYQLCIIHWNIGLALRLCLQLWVSPHHQQPLPGVQLLRAQCKKQPTKNKKAGREEALPLPTLYLSFRALFSVLRPD